METIEDKKLISKNTLLKKKIKVLYQKLRRRNIRIQAMKQCINEIERKLMIMRDEASLLHNNFYHLQLSVFTVYKTQEENQQVEDMRIQ